MNGAQALVEVLRLSGVTHIFGLPGDTSMSFYDALREARGDIRHIMTRDERSASFMADVYARASGKVGICEGPSGGGATYIIPGVAEAQGSAIPLLCLTTDTPVNQQGMGVLTEIDQAALFRPLTKWNTRIDHVETVPATVRRALRMATAGRPGATALSLPEDILFGDFEGTDLYGVPEFGSVPAAPTRPDATSIAIAAQAIETSHRPVIVAGGGVVTGRAWAELTQLAETWNIPVGTSINGKGSIAETSPVSIGVVGGNGARSYSNQVVAEADLVIYIGNRTESTTTMHWKLPSRQRQPAVIQIDVEPKEVGNNYQLVTPVIGDSRLALIDLLDAISDPQKVAARNRPRIESLLVERERYWQEVEAQAATESHPIKPQVVVRALRNLLDDSALIVADPGTPTPYLSAQYELRVPGRTTIIPRAHGGLGYALPGVVGAAMAKPQAQIVGMSGDGSFGMSVGELETITRLGLPVVLIQCSNNSYGWIKELQHLHHDDHYFSVDFNGIDYATIARGFGLQSRSVKEARLVEPAIREALADGRPWFIDITTESPITETPPVAGWEAAEAARLAGVPS